MKTHIKASLLTLVLLSTLNSQLSTLFAQGTVFTYQGRLKTSGDQASGTYDFRFRLSTDALGNTYVGSPVIADGQQVKDGLFVVMLDFGDVFSGADYWLQIEVRTNGVGGYAVLNPLQQFTTTPYAMRAADAGRLEGRDLAFLRNADNLNAGLLDDARIPAGITRDGEVIGLVVANDGASSGLDADLLDGLNSTAFVNSSGPATITGSSSSSSSPILTVTQSASQNGILATTTSTDSGEAAVVGRAGSVAASLNSVAGVFGTSASGRGVVGSSTSNDGILGFSSSAAGVSGESLSGNGVEGSAYATSGTVYGVKGNSSSSTQGAGVRGESAYVGVWGESSGRWGVYGRATGTSSAYGVYGTVGAGTGNYAGYFSGDARVTGTLTKGGGAFKIDHPLDPENRYLSHSFVESPDMMNVYNGTLELDATGEGWVQLPEYFEALNRDFRYQLTPLGGPGPNLHIAQKVQANAFKIAGGTPHLEVSWQITGIRHDAFANANRIVVEEDKPEEDRGTYLHPDAYDRQKGAVLKPRMNSSCFNDPAAAATPQPTFSHALRQLPSEP